MEVKWTEGSSWASIHVENSGNRAVLCEWPRTLPEFPKRSKGKKQVLCKIKKQLQSKFWFLVFEVISINFKHATNINYRYRWYSRRSHWTLVLSLRKQRWQKCGKKEKFRISSKFGLSSSTHALSFECNVLQFLADRFLWISCLWKLFNGIKSNGRKDFQWYLSVSRLSLDS